jgi:predicted PurR-regulated permease PerM
MKSKFNVLVVVFMFVLLIVNLFLFIEVSNLNTKINNVNSSIKNVDKDITCGETLVNSPTGNSCIGLKDQLNTIQDKLH